MKVAVIGAGVSGLSFAKYAFVNGVKVKVFDKDSKVGGIARVKDVGGCPYHMVGGHCFNSKHKDVLDFVFGHVLPLDSWRKVQRRASILFDGCHIPYPIEYSMKDIYNQKPEKALEYIEDYFKATRGKVENLADWFSENFGVSLARDYFIPYNKKIWGRNPASMSPDWVVDKLPQPDMRSFISGLIGSASDNMPHSSFYYPKSGTQNTFIDALAKNLDISLGVHIEKVIRNSDGTFTVAGECFDKVVYTGGLNKVSNVFDVESPDVLKAVNSLEYNKVTTMLWESEPTDDTWTYIPDEKILFHRLINISNFTDIPVNVSISEAVGEVSYEDMVAAGAGLKQLKRPLGYNVSDYAYVVFNKSINENKLIINNYFEGSDIHLLGRFGQWDYFNMDICIYESMKLFRRIFS